MSDRDDAAPDVLGLALEEAQARLADAGWQVIETRWVGLPGAGEEAQGPRRVVRVRKAGTRAVSLDYVTTRETTA